MTVALQRVVLVLGSADGPLARIALRLVDLGLEVGFATHLDELLLLAMEKQKESGIGSIFVESDHDPIAIEQLIERLDRGDDLGPESLVVAGEGGIEAEALQQLGIRWRVPRFASDQDLHFLANVVTWSRDPMNLRAALRVPTDLPVEVRSLRGTRAARMADLSERGGFIALHPPLDVGSGVGLKLVCGRGSIEIEARVRWVRHSDAGGGRAGIGVEFDAVSEAEKSAWSPLIAQALERFSIAPASVSSQR